MKFKTYKDWHSHGRMFSVAFGMHDFRAYFFFKDDWTGPVELQHRVYEINQRGYKSINIDASTIWPKRRLRK